MATMSGRVRHRVGRCLDCKKRRALDGTGRCNNCGWYYAHHQVEHVLMNRAGTEDEYCRHCGKQS